MANGHEPSKTWSRTHRMVTNPSNGHEPIEDKDKANAKDRAENNGEVQEETWFAVVEHAIEEVAAPPPVLFLRVLKQELPYIVMLLAAIVGIGLASFTGQLTPLYWEVLVPLYGVICIYTGWRQVEGLDAQVRLAWTQAAHWLAVLLAMYVIYLPQVQDVMNNNAAGITLMAILALATVLAGIHAAAWQICVVGVILAIAVPIIAWIHQSALMTTVGLIGVIFVAFVALRYGPSWALRYGMVDDTYGVAQSVEDDVSRLRNANPKTPDEGCIEPES
jgi:hypothetical protein